MFAAVGGGKVFNVFNVFNILFIGFMVSLFFRREAGGSFLLNTGTLWGGRGQRSVVPRHTASRCTLLRGAGAEGGN